MSETEPAWPVPDKQEEAIAKAAYAAWRDEARLVADLRAQLQQEREMADRLADAAVQPQDDEGLGFRCWLCGCFWQRECSERHYDGCPIPAYRAMREGQRGA